MDASLLSFFPLFVYCLHALHLVLTLVQDVGRAHKVDGEDSEKWTQRNYPRFLPPLYFFSFAFVSLCNFCACAVCVCYCYEYVIFTLPTTWLIFRFGYSCTRSSISPFSERNRGVTEMGTYLMKILIQTYLLLLFSVIYCYLNTFI